MTEPLFRVLALAEAPSAPGFAVELAPSWAGALELLAGVDTVDAALIDADALADAPFDVATIAERVALVILIEGSDFAVASEWLQQGADDVMSRAELAADGGWRRVQFAIERRRRAAHRQTAFSTDAGTGLPHRQQLVEHLSQLLALREREPAPMAVLAFRIEGIRSRGGDGDGAAAAALRRKIAVRMRVGVRGSDIVAALDDDVFVVLLGSILTAADAERVAAKLVAALLSRPFVVGATPCSIAVALGVAHYPRDGQDAERLIWRATSMAGATAAAPTSQAASSRPGAARTAANDDA